MPPQFKAGELQAFSSDFKKNVTVLSSCSLIYTCCLCDNFVVISMTFMTIICVVCSLLQAVTSEYVQYL